MGRLSQLVCDCGPMTRACGNGLLNTGVTSSLVTQDTEPAEVGILTSGRDNAPTDSEAVRGGRPRATTPLRRWSTRLRHGCQRLVEAVHVELDSRGGGAERLEREAQAS